MQDNVFLSNWNNMQKFRQKKIQKKKIHTKSSLSTIFDQTIQLTFRFNNHIQSQRNCWLLPLSYKELELRRM